MPTKALHRSCSYMISACNTIYLLLLLTFIFIFTLVGDRCVNLMGLFGDGWGCCAVFLGGSLVYLMVESSRLDYYYYA